ncbi:YybH family protein [Leucobacter iarius]
MEPLTDSAAEVLALVETMYAGYLRRDTSAIDALLSPELTMFDSSEDALVHGMDELQALRARRGSGSGAPADSAVPAAPAANPVTETALVVESIEARPVGGTIVATWWLRVDAEDANGRPVSPERSRNTAVLTRGADGALTIAHIHEDVREPLGSVAG